LLGDLRPTGTQQTVSMVTRLRVFDLARMALAWAISSLALIAADQLLPGMEAGSPWQLVAAAAVTGIFGILVRPVPSGVTR
jgi:hypothetical protein